VLRCVEETQVFVMLLTAVLVVLNASLAYYTIVGLSFQNAIAIFFAMPVAVTLLALLLAFSLPLCKA
jgi:hypothetical protein